MKHKKGDRVRWEPDPNSDWMSGEGPNGWCVITPPIGTEGKVKGKVTGKKFSQSSDFPGGTISVRWDTGLQTYFPADYCKIIEASPSTPSIKPFTMEIDDRVRWEPGDDPTWGPNTTSGVQIPPVGTEGTVTSVYDFTSSIQVTWDNGMRNSYPREFCIPVEVSKIKLSTEEAKGKKKITNAGRDVCFKCGQPTKYMEWGIPGADSQWCPICKI